MSDYVLLYNVFGYPAKGPKRALLRAIEPQTETVPTLWQLYTPNQEEVAHGVPKKEKLTYGAEVWSCDFSFINWMDMFSLKVTFSDGSSVVSSEFDVGGMPYLSQLGLRLSVHAAKARFSRGLPDGGYYDCNSRMGEAYSHGVYLNGLCWFDVMHRRYLTTVERSELRWAQQEAFDYLIKICNPETGEVYNCSKDRYCEARNLGLFNTIEALSGMSAYVSLIGEEDPQRSNPEMLAQLERCFWYCYGSELQPEELILYSRHEWLPTIACHLYRATGKAEYLHIAREYVLDKLPMLDLRTMPNSAGRSINVFEGMYLLKTLSPDVTQDPRWDACMRINCERIRELLERNSYHLPPMATEGYAAESWDDMARMPAGDKNNAYATQWFCNSDIALWGIQACYLMLLTGDNDFALSAAGAVNFISGMHFGLPGDMVNPPSEDKLCCAPFLVNMEKCVKDWKRWFVRLPGSDWTSVVNGYIVQDGKPFYSDEGFITGETFIKTDGLFLYLISLYECVVNDELPEVLKA